MYLEHAGSSNNSGARRADRLGDRPVEGGVRDSTVKNTVAAMVLVLDEAVRDELLVLGVGVTYSRWSAQSGLTPRH